jgi:hypothetical protein
VAVRCTDAAPLSAPSTDFLFLSLFLFRPFCSKLNAQQAFMKGKIKLKGNMMLAQ